MQQLILDLLRRLTAAGGALIRWIASNWGYSLMLVGLTVLLLAAARLFLPAGVFLSLREALVQRSGLSPELGTFVGLLAAAAVIAVNASILAWLVFGRKPEAAAVAVVVIAVIGFAPNLMRANFDSKGQPQKWFWRDERGQVQISDVERSPATGEQLQALTPHAAREAERQQRRAPRLRTQDICAIAFFDGATGVPLVWWASDSRGSIRLYDGPGFDLRNSDELRPVDRAAVEAWTGSCQRQ